jgi:hypothetical protein
MAKNGPVPAKPNKDQPVVDAMHEYDEDCRLADRQRRAREGLCEAYTKAPWLKGEEK